MPSLQELRSEHLKANDELRRRLRSDGNGAAADNMRIEAAGFEDACDFKEVGADAQLRVRQQRGRASKEGQMTAVPLQTLSRLCSSVTCEAGN